MAPSRALGLACALVLAARGVPAVTLYDNGPVTDPAKFGLCDSAPLACGGTGSWTYYDNFVLASDSIVTGFDYTDWFDFGTPADYVATSWSLFAADPFSSAAIASGSALAILTPNGPADQFRFEIGGLGIAVSAGVEYWLGISNTLSGGAVTSVTRVDNPGSGLDAAKQSDGVSDLDLPSFENRAFRVEGTVVPEPATGALVGLGIVSLGLARRVRSRSLF